MDSKDLFFIGLYPNQPARFRCPFPENSTLLLCEMVLDENVCKCFAFDSNDGIHWTAVGLGVVILAVCAFIYIRYRRNKKKKKNEGRTRMLPLQEIVSQCK